MLFTLIIFISASFFGFAELFKKPTDLIPEGYILLEQLNGDLNNDGIDDCVLFIKGLDKDKIVNDENKGELDLNRRGIIILFKKNDGFEIFLKNYECFTSEDEYNGPYYAPELSISIDKGNLYFDYNQGGKGRWKFTFRIKNTDFELIGFDYYYRSEFASDWITFDYGSINLITKKKLIKEVISVDEDGNENFKETWKRITIKKQIKLSEIQNFYELSKSDFIID